ncbi:hypothetical protein [Glycomyces algeriensis]|nr:hypothetical protein [Glycomyces algeriensis]MDA1368783.1 hypothetical protein [Glycomyces algeriensis]MDR7349403.1 hypothetical protein [Glycomyces algeriensis]
MFNREHTEAETESTKGTWRAVVVGAAVPLAMLAAAPAVSAAEVETHAVETHAVGTHAVQTVNGEQLPPLPVDPPPGLPDPTALAKLPDLLKCVTDLLAALPADAPAAPAPPVEGSEQLPPPPAPAPGGDAPLPDIAALTTQCQDALAKLPPPPVAPPVAE